MNNGFIANYNLCLDSLVISLLSMILTAAYIYLPNHLVAIYGHLHYYLVGERPFISADIPFVSSGLKGGSQTLGALYEMVKNGAVVVMMGRSAANE